jgi:ADP-heptose:LPS heptosyltransferase
VSGRVLVARLDDLGDVLLTGPAIRAIAAHADTVVCLAGPNGAPAARLLPGVDDTIVWRAPWIDPDPEQVDPAEIERLAALVRRLRPDAALIFTSFHQSPLPLALVLRMANVPWTGAISVDYPGSLLDLRHRVDDDIPEPERALALASAAGFDLPSGDDGRLAVRRPLPDVDELIGSSGYVVLHPGASAPARRWPVRRCAAAARTLTEAGYRVIVTGGPGERQLTAEVAGTTAVDLGGRTDLAGLASIMAGADAVVVANTGPAHLAAAVGTPVVSLFAPVVPAVRWAPYGVPTILLGDQNAPCRDTRARNCPVPGHPCLAEVTDQDVLLAVRKLLGEPT